MWQIWLNWQCNKLSDCGIAVTFYDWQQVGPPHLQFRDPCCRCLVLAILWAAGSKLQWHDLQATTGRVTMDKEKSLSQVKATAFEKPSKYCTRMSNECNVWFFRLDSENVITCTHTHNAGIAFACSESTRMMKLSLLVCHSFEAFCIPQGSCLC